MDKENLLLFSGDIHGELKKLVWKVTIQLGLENVSLVVAGDFGVGFGAPGSMEVLYNSVKDRLEKYNITIYAVRGNHDDPSWFDGTHDYPRLRFLQDYKVYEIEGKTILPIGGAHSTDRESRIEDNLAYEKYGSRKRCWWPGEVIKKVPISELPDKVDIIVTHEAPISFEPIIVREMGDGLKLWEDILDSRQYLNQILQEVKADLWIHGHYHRSTSGSYGDLLYRGLDIHEIYTIY